MDRSNALEWMGVLRVVNFAVTLVLQGAIENAKKR